MAQSIHITVARRMIDSGKPVTLDLWTKDGRIHHWDNCIGLRYSRVMGTRQIKLLGSREIRTVRDVCIFRINGYDITL